MVSSDVADINTRQSKLYIYGSRCHTLLSLGGYSDMYRAGRNQKCVTCLRTASRVRITVKYLARVDRFCSTREALGQVLARTGKAQVLLQSKATLGCHQLAIGKQTEGYARNSRVSAGDKVRS